MFNTLVYMSGITAAIPYGVSALAQIKWRVRTTARRPHPEVRPRRHDRRRRAGDVTGLFIWYSRNTRSRWEEWVPFVFAGIACLLGIPVYLSQRGSMSEPAPVPDVQVGGLDMSFHVDSEVGVLRQVIVHRPGSSCRG